MIELDLSRKITEHQQNRQRQSTRPATENSVLQKSRSGTKKTKHPSQYGSQRDSQAAVKPCALFAKATMETVAEPNRLSTDDIDKISKVVNLFKDQKNLDQFSVNAIIQKDAKKSEDSRELWKFMRQNLPSLPKQKVINVCRRKFHNFEARGSWTLDEDKELTALHGKYPGKWKKIGELMNRFHEDCRDRWRNYLVCGDRMKKTSWEFEEEEKLRLIVEEYLENFRRRHGKTETDSSHLIDWQAISKKMGHTRSRLQCSHKWKAIKDRYETDEENLSLTEPFSKTQWRLDMAERMVSSMSIDEKLHSLLAIRRCGAKQVSKIPWVQIKKTNSSITGNKLALRIMLSRLIKMVPNCEQMKLQDIIQYLIDKFKNSLSTKEPYDYPKPTTKQCKRKISHFESKSNKKQKINEPIKATLDRSSTRMVSAEMTDEVKRVKSNG